MSLGTTQRHITQRHFWQKLAKKTLEREYKRLSLTSLGNALYIYRVTKTLPKDVFAQRKG